MSHADEKYSLTLMKMHLTHGDIIYRNCERIDDEGKRERKDTHLMSCGHFCMSCHCRDKVLHVCDFNDRAESSS